MKYDSKEWQDTFSNKHKLISQKEHAISMQKRKVVHQANSYRRNVNRNK